ncbi:L,D-transpeptidase Cds6 family protein [Helicobacter muridarum]|nr:L,D-transpeptidase family protein [Helicobacter muridarum]STQ85514.1 conserved hypothetical secreted protein [Helicobacter muridarum]
MKNILFSIKRSCLLTFILSVLALSDSAHELTKKEYWLDYLQDKSTNYGYFEDLGFLFVSDKSIPNLTLYKIKNFQLEEIQSSSALVAEGLGSKKKEGDMTTPIGVYNINNRYTKLDQYYGGLALSTTYPNAYDRSLKRTGSGIWIHGKPLNGDRKELHTRGCIVIENDLLHKYDKIVNWRDSSLLVYESELAIVTKDELATLLAFIYQYKQALESGENRAFKFYDKSFKDINGNNLATFWNAKQKELAKMKQPLAFTKINIFIYPNDSNRRLFRISFNWSNEKHDSKSYDNSNATKILNTSKTTLLSGKVELYVALQDSNPNIISQK